MSLPPATSSDSRQDWANGDPLIAKYIEPHPHKPGVENARITQYGYSVWILIDALRATDNDTARVASEYEIPEEAVLAAIAFYNHHRHAIDTHIDESAAFYSASA